MMPEGSCMRETSLLNAYPLCTLESFYGLLRHQGGETFTKLFPLCGKSGRIVLEKAFQRDFCFPEELPGIDPVNAQPGFHPEFGGTAAGILDIAPDLPADVDMGRRKYFFRTLEVILNDGEQGKTRLVPGVVQIVDIIVEHGCREAFRDEST